MAGGRTITQRIALDGGADVTKELQSIGKAAVDAFAKLAGVGAADAALGKIGTSVDQVAKRINALKDAGGNFGGAFGGLTSSVTSVIERLGILSSVSIAGAVTGFIALIKQAGDAQEALQNTADTLGVSAEKYQALQQAAELSGIGGDQLTRALSKQVGAMRAALTSSTGYNKALDDLKQKLHDGEIGYQDYLAKLAKVNRDSDKTKNAFERLGVSISDNGKTLRDPLETFRDISDAFKSMPDGADKASIAMEIWGTRNSKLTAFANAGADGIKKMTLEAERLAPALDKKGRAALDRAADAFKTLGDATASTKNQILAVFAPDVSALVEAYTNVVANSRAAWVDYAKTLEAQVKPVVQDVIAVIEGRDQDVKNTFVLEARDAILDFGKAVQNAVTNIIIPAFKGFLKVLDTVASAINSVFGTHLTGGQIAIVLVVGQLLGLFGPLAAAVSLAGAAFGLLSAALGGPLVVAAVAAAAAIGFLITKLALNLGSIGEVADRVLRGIPILAQGAANLVFSAFAALGGLLVGVFNGIVSLAASAFSGIVSAFSGIPSAIGSVFSAVAEIASNVWVAIAEGVVALGSSIVESFTNVVAAIVGFFTGLPGALLQAFQALVTMATDAWGVIEQGAVSLAEGVIDAFKSVVSGVSSALDGLLNIAQSIFSAIIAGAQSVASAISGAASSGGGGGGSGSGGDSGPAMAGGGMVRGPGTGTSDSIRAWLSNGEFVQRFAAVRRYGLSFMKALNEGRIPVSRVRDLMSGVDFGGLQAVMPGRTSFATGGLATVAPGGGGQAVNLHFGDKSFSLQGTPEVVRELVTTAQSRHARSAGRKPTWFGGGK